MQIVPAKICLFSEQPAHPGKFPPSAADWQTFFISEEEKMDFLHFLNLSFLQASPDLLTIAALRKTEKAKL